MTQWYVREADKRNEDGNPLYVLFCDGRLAERADYAVITAIVRKEMSPGDTYQEASSPVCSYEEMADLWRRVDALDG